MIKTLETRLQIANWDEKPYRELPDGRKFTRAEVQLGGSPEGIESGAFEALMYYRTDGTTAQVRYRVVESSGELAGLTGRGASRSTHADYPYLPLTLEYELT